MKGAQLGAADSSLPVAAQVRNTTHLIISHEIVHLEINVLVKLKWIMNGGVVIAGVYPCASQDSTSCGGHSSSGSTSSLSTPPSVSQSPPQPQLNGVVGANPAGLGGVAGLMGALGAGSALGMGGIVGALNGVIQTPAGTASPHTHTTGAATGVTLPVNNR